MMLDFLRSWLKKAPSGNGFSWYSTADDAAKGVDLTGKTAIVTGANSGIGKESARVLAQHGAYTVFTSRDLKKGEEAMADMVKAGAPAENLKLMQLDLADSQSVRKFAEEFKALGRPLHILMNNAGVMACPYGTTADGFEMQIGTNHLGHFLLTSLLIDDIRKAGKGARIVNTSSIAHLMADKVPESVEDIEANWFKVPQNKYDKWVQYGRSKVANIWFTKELARKYADEGIVAICLHPGVIATNLTRHGSELSTSTMGFFRGIFVKDIPKGAATQIFAAVNPLAESMSGMYLDCCNPAEPSAQASNPENAKNFWAASEAAWGIKW